MKKKKKKKQKKKKKKKKKNKKKTKIKKQKTREISSGSEWRPNAIIVLLIGINRSWLIRANY